MYLVDVRIGGTTPLSSLAPHLAVVHHVVATAHDVHRCAFRVPSPETTEATLAACSSTCDGASVVAPGTIDASCTPREGSACALRDPRFRGFASAVPDGVLHSVSPSGAATLLTFLVRGNSPEEARDAVQRSAAAASLPVAALRVAEFRLDLAGEALRPIERETLSVALALGYYESPRRCTMDDIGTLLGISKSAVYHRLSALERRALLALAERDGQQRV